MRKYTLSKRDTEKVLRALERWPLKEKPKAAKGIMIMEIAEGRNILISDAFIVAELAGEHIPFLAKNEILSHFPRVTVDPGAIPFICNGADVMRPGIVRFEGDFQVNDLVAVKEERHEKFIAVGKALKSSPEASGVAKGAILKSLHYIGDAFWEAYKQLGSIT